MALLILQSRENDQVDPLCGDTLVARNQSQTKYPLIACKSCVSPVGFPCDGNGCVNPGDQAVTGCFYCETAPPMYSVTLGPWAAYPQLGGNIMLYTVPNDCVWASSIITITDGSGCCAYYQYLLYNTGNTSSLQLVWVGGTNPLSAYTVKWHYDRSSWNCNCSNSMIRDASSTFPPNQALLPVICIVPVLMGEGGGGGIGAECPWPCVNEFDLYGIFCVTIPEMNLNGTDDCAAEVTPLYRVPGFILTGFQGCELINDQTTFTGTFPVQPIPTGEGVWGAVITANISFINGINTVQVTLARKLADGSYVNATYYSPGDPTVCLLAAPPLSDGGTLILSLLGSSITAGSSGWASTVSVKQGVSEFIDGASRPTCDVSSSSSTCSNC